MAPFKKYVTYMMVFFISFVSVTLSVLALSFLLSYSLKLKYYRMKGKKNFYIYDCFNVARYIEVEN